MDRVKIKLFEVIKYDETLTCLCLSYLHICPWDCHAKKAHKIIKCHMEMVNLDKEVCYQSSPRGVLRPN